MTYRNPAVQPGCSSDSFHSVQFGTETGELLSEHGIVCMDVGAGCMHIVAVSGVLYLFLGFFGIARKPVNWGFLGTRQPICT